MPNLPFGGPSLPAEEPGRRLVLLEGSGEVVEQPGEPVPPPGVSSRSDVARGNFNSSGPSRSLMFPNRQTRFQDLIDELVKEHEEVVEALHLRVITATTAATAAAARISISSSAGSGIGAAGHHDPATFATLVRGAASPRGGGGGGRAPPLGLQEDGEQQDGISVSSPRVAHEASMADRPSMFGAAGVFSELSSDGFDNPAPEFELRQAWVPGKTLTQKIEARAVSSDVLTVPIRTAALRKHGHRGLDKSLSSHLGASLVFLNEDTVRFMLHPQSNARLAWDVLSLFAIAYDMVVMPLQLFVIPEDTFNSTIADWLTTLFWTLDMGMAFVTAVYVDGEVSYSRRVIAKRYLRTWLLLDLIVVLPEWTSLFTADRFMSHFSAIRSLRMMRLLRLLRLMKLDRVIQACQVRLNSNFAHHCISICRLVVAVVIFNHFLACIWFKIGSSSTAGWVMRDDVQSQGLLYGYFTALHWAVTQFQASMEVFPRTVGERIFSVAVVLVALTGFSAFVSRITDMMIQLQKLNNDKTMEEHTLRSYLKEHSISASLSVRVKLHVEHHMARAHKREAEHKLLSALPKNVLMDLHDESRSPSLEVHTFFQQLRQGYPRVLRMICSDAVGLLFFQKDETVFTSGDACTHMFFVQAGALVYLIDENVLRSFDTSRVKYNEICTEYKLRRGEWISEVALWMMWENTGDLYCTQSCHLLTVDFQHCAQVLKHFESAYMDAIVYALNFLDLAKEAAYVSDLGAVAPTAQGQPYKLRASISPWTSGRRALSSDQV